MHEAFRRVLSEFREGDVQPENSKINIIIHNLVLVVYYGDTAEIQNRYVEHHPECRSGKETFPSLTLMFGRPKGTMMQFLSGRTVFVGGANYSSTLYLALVFRLRLEAFRREYMPNFPKEKLVFGHPKLENLVFTTTLPGAPFDIGKFAADTSDVKYNPTSFPGATIGLLNSDGDPLGTAVFFEEGKLNFMGCKSQEDAETGVTYLANKLLPYSCKSRGIVNEIVTVREKEYLEAIAAARARLNEKSANITTVIASDDAFKELFTDDLMEICLE